MKKKTLQGYTFTRSVDNFSIPTNIQSMIIRYYCMVNNYTFKLHLDEFCIKNSYIQLFQILNTQKIDSIAMCSLIFLPKEKNKLEKILKKAKEKNIELIFIFENIKFKNENVNKFIQNIQQIRKISYLTNK